MRAVRAVRAALPARPIGFRWCPVEVAGFLAGLSFAAAVVFPEVVGFFAAFAFAEREEPDLAGASPEDWPASGVATSRTDSNPARQRDARRGAEFGEAKTLISSLYAAFARTQRPGTTGVTALNAESSSIVRSNRSFSTDLATMPTVDYTGLVRA